VNLEEILRALYDGAVEFVIIGGAAMQFQGSARLTEGFLLPEKQAQFRTARKNFASLSFSSERRSGRPLLVPRIWKRSPNLKPCRNTEKKRD